MNKLERILGPDLVAALEQLVNDRVEAALAERAFNGGSPWLTLAQVAERLRVSERTVARLIRRGRIRTSTLGRRRLVHVDDLDEIVREGAA